MLDIDTLALTLPAGFGPRAARIGRLIGEHLAQRAPELGSGRIETLALPPVNIQPSWSDQRIASHVAERLVSQLHRTMQQAAPVNPQPFTLHEGAA